MKINDKDRIIQEYNEKMKQRRNEIQQAEDRFVKEHIKAFFVGWAIFALVFIIYFLHWLLYRIYHNEIY